MQAKHLQDMSAQLVPAESKPSWSTNHETPPPGAGGIAGKMKLFMGQEPEISEMDLPSVPEEEPIERPPYYDIMIHTPVEGT